MTELVDALRAKYRTPQDALRALGLDEGLLQTKGGKPKKRSAVAKALKDAIKARSGIAQDADLQDLLSLLDALKKSEEGHVSELETALGEVKEAEGEEKEEEAKGEEPAMKGKEPNPEDVQERTDEFEPDEPPAKKEKDMAGLEPSAGIPANLEKERENPEERIGGDEPAAKLHAILKDKLSPEEMQAVGEILAELAGSEEKAEDAEPEEPSDLTTEDEESEESKRANKKDGPDAVIGTGGLKEGKTAMDARTVRIAVDAAIKAERNRQTAIRDAERELRRAGIGETGMSFDSAADVYRFGLKAKEVEGVDGIKDLTSLKALWGAVAKLPTERAAPSKRLGMDAKASKSFFDRFPNASRIGH